MTYEPYSNDKRFMEREGDPCRHCLRPMLEHYNGRCPKDEDEDDDHRRRNCVVDQEDEQGQTS